MAPSTHSLEPSSATTLLDDLLLPFPFHFLHLVPLPDPFPSQA
jgi:hypothetical protein